MSRTLLRLLCFLTSFFPASALRANVLVSLTQVQRIHEECMEGLCSVCASPDGKHVYAAGLRSSSVNILSVNKDTGKLTIAGVCDPKNTGGLLGVRISPDGTHVACYASQAACVTLFERNASDGSLTELSAFTKSDNADLASTAECVFSTDGKHIYIASRNGGVITVSTAGGKLTQVQQVNTPGVTDGARGVAVHPDGNLVALCASTANSLVLFSRDPKSGKLTQLAVATEGADKVSGIEGIFRAAFSPDGKYLYTSSGRFSGTSAVCAFAVGGVARLSQLGRVVIAGSYGVPWEGGNSVAVSPVKGDNLIVATASLSDSIAELRCNPETGIAGFCGSLPSGAKGEPGLAGVCFSPDARFIYAADEDEGALFVYSSGARRRK